MRRMTAFHAPETKSAAEAKVKAEVTYTPTGGDPTIVGNTDTKTVKLVKR